jgi:hypothetical protein
MKDEMEECKKCGKVRYPMLTFSGGNYKHLSTTLLLANKI